MLPDWLLLPIDASRVHDIDAYLAWHARLMVLGWGILSPLAILVARFFKITKRQNWPQKLDNKLWWRSHFITQSLVTTLMLLAVSLIVMRNSLQFSGLHGWLGWGMVLLAALQFLSGWVRGSKGGPTKPNPDGSWRGAHYDMSLQRKAFEYFHKTNGYLIICLSVVTVISGLWTANAPIWMWLVIGVWWLMIVLAFVYLQRQGRAFDTYQAIWGADKQHPGNRMKPIGWGIRRLSQSQSPFPKDPS